MPFDNVIRLYIVSNAKAAKQMCKMNALSGTSKWHYWMQAKHQLHTVSRDDNVPLQVVRCLSV